jgi:hypothetical protein
MSVARSRQEQAGEAADGEQEDEAQGIQHRRGEAIEPLYIVASQLKTLIAEGIATLKVSKLKIMPPGRLTAREHVVAPDEEAEQCAIARN